MDVFTALAEPTRRSIVEMLASRGRLSASQICERFPISAPAISQHLKVLREARLVRVERRAQQRIYELNPDAMHELEDWARKVRELQKSWDEQFNALDRVLEAEVRRGRTDDQDASSLQEANDG